MIRFQTVRISTIDQTQKIFFNRGYYTCRLAIILIVLMMPGTGVPINPSSSNISQATTSSSIIRDIGHAEQTLEKNISLDGVSPRTPESEQKPIDGSIMSCRPKIPKKPSSLKTLITDQKSVLSMNASTAEPNKVRVKLVLLCLQCY